MLKRGCVHDRADSGRKEAESPLARMIRVTAHNYVKGLVRHEVEPRNMAEVKALIVPSQPLKGASPGYCYYER
ncbi:hypothetical protein N7475_000259 [Penicillium sp. IBT 31633x]|nr:hypothetical protein N7475_000259 [Penicillium sp. IBT 31633x]